MRMISLAANYNSFFTRCHSNTAAFAPDLKLGCWVFGFCGLHCSSRLHLACPVAFESARRQRRCNRPDVCKCRAGRSTPVFPPIEADVFPLLRSGRERTKWASGIFGSERRDTIECRLWAIEKYSMNLTSALFQTSAVRAYKDSSWKYSTRHEEDSPGMNRRKSA
jgi:hypothetical protein